MDYCSRGRPQEIGGARKRRGAERFGAMGGRSGKRSRQTPGEDKTGSHYRATNRGAMHLRFTPPVPGCAQLTGGHYCQWETPYGVNMVRLVQGIAHQSYRCQT